MKYRTLYGLLFTLIPISLLFILGTLPGSKDEQYGSKATDPSGPTLDSLPPGHDFTGSYQNELPPYQQIRHYKDAYPKDPIKEETLSNNAIKKLFSKLKTKAGRIFLKSTKSDTVISGSKGTTVSIPKNAFQTKKGKPYTGPVHFLLKECTTFEEVVREDLLTVTEDGRIMTSGGMVRTEVYTADNERLELRKGKEISIGFPMIDSTGKSNMTLFTGERSNPDGENGMEWERIERTLVDSLRSLAQRNATHPPYFQVELIRNKYSTSDDVGNTPNVRSFDRSIHKDLVHYLNWYFYMVDVPLQRFTGKKVRLSYYLGSDGIIARNSVHVSSSDTLLSQRLYSFFEEIPAFDHDSPPPYQSTEVYREFLISEKPRKSYDTTGLGTSLKWMVRGSKSKNAFLVDLFNKGFYSFTTSSLGWANLDRLEKVPTKQVIVQAPRNAVIRCYIPEYRMYLPAEHNGEEWVIENVPENSQARVVALSYDREKPAFGMRSFDPSRENKLSVKIKNTTFQEMKRTLKRWSMGTIEVI